MTLPDDKDRQLGDRGGEYADKAKNAPPVRDPKQSPGKTPGTDQKDSGSPAVRQPRQR